jgi:16S rRNA G966 N2-methylase RsmD
VPPTKGRIASRGLACAKAASVKLTINTTKNSFFNMITPKNNAPNDKFPISYLMQFAKICQWLNNSNMLIADRYF